MKLRDGEDGGYAADNESTLPRRKHQIESSSSYLKTAGDSVSTQNFSQYSKSEQSSVSTSPFSNPSLPKGLSQTQGSFPATQKTTTSTFVSSESKSSQVKKQWTVTQ